MNSSADQDFAATIVTFEEHARGWLAEVQRARDIHQQIRPYDQLLCVVRYFQAWKIVRFGENAARRFQDLRTQRIRIGSMDLKIASIVLENSATLLSANARDFQWCQD